MTTALTVASQPGALTYMREAVVNPVSLSVVAFGTCIGAGMGGLVGAIIGATGTVLMGAATGLTGPVRRAIDSVRRERAKKKWVEVHRNRLKETGPVRTQQYLDLREIADRIAEHDPSFDVESLLDLFVDLSVEKQRCLDALRLCNGGDGGSSVMKSVMYREIYAQKNRLRDDLIDRMSSVEGQLEEIESLLRVVVVRVVMPAKVEDAEQRVAEMLEAEKALSELR